MNEPIPDATLDDTAASALRLLSRAVADRHSAFHEPTLGTRGSGGMPSLRTIVLRAFDPGARTLRFYSDRRAAKIAELAAHPFATVHGYDARARIQLRMAGPMAVLTEGPLVDLAWANSSAPSRQGYAVQPPPGSALDQPAGAPASVEGGRENFAVLTLQLDSLEWLRLGRDGHRRARFTWLGGQREGQWLVP